MNKRALNKAISDLEQMIQDLENVRDPAQEAYDEKSDKWREGEKGVQVQEALDILENALTSLGEAKDSLEEITSQE